MIRYVKFVFFQLYSVDVRKWSRPLFQYEAPNYSSIPSFLPKVPLATLGACGSLLHVVSPISRPVSLFTFMIDSPVSIGSKPIRNIGQSIDSYSQLICYEEKTILL